MKEAIYKLFAVVLPSCRTHSTRIATHRDWIGHLCDSCARKIRVLHPDHVIDEHNYAQSVRSLEHAE